MLSTAVRSAWKALIAALIISLACPWPLLAQVTQKEERELGAKVQVQIAASGLLFDDPVVYDYYYKVAERVLRGAGPQPYPYHFYIINNSGINAFAVPGGYIYMHTETLISLENEGELASILAHEVAHITSRHFARRMEAAKEVSLLALAATLAGILVGAQGGSAGAALGPALMMGGTGASVQAMLAHSRSDESEADGKGRRYMVQAGYNPRDMYGAFKIMLEKTYQISSDMPSYLSTHPDLSYRLSTTFQDYADAPAPPPDQAYLGIRDRVLALSGEPRRVRALLNERLQRDQNDASALHALGLLAAREQNLSLADKLMNQALALSPNNREYLGDLGGLALKRRRPEEARRFLEKSGLGNPQALLSLARACELLKQNTQAAVYYEKAAGFSETMPYSEALQMAGRFFGRNGQVGKGHYYLARYFVSRGDLNQAVFHYEAALKAPDLGALRARSQKNLSELTIFMEDSGYPKPKK